jgi:hypothetical protein
MITTAQIMIPSVTCNVFNSGYPNYNQLNQYNWVGDPIKAAGYYSSPSGLQTIAYYVTNFNGSFVFEATLESEPNVANNSPSWFTVANVTGWGSNTFTTSTPSAVNYTVTSELFLADGNTANYTLQNYLTNDTVIVSQDGVVQIPFNPSRPDLPWSYNIDGRTLAFSEPPLEGIYVEVREFFTPINVQPISSKVIPADGINSSFNIETGNYQYSTNGTVVSVNGIVQIPKGSSDLSNTIGSYTVTSTLGITTNSSNVNVTAYTNTLVFDWIPLAGDLIEIREYYQGNAIPKPSFSGAGVLNVDGNFTWMRCRVVDWTTNVPSGNGNVTTNSTINKVTLSY